jgi:hypothetical protein
LSNPRRGKKHRQVNRFRNKVRPRFEIHRRRPPHNPFGPKFRNPEARFPRASMFAHCWWNRPRRYLPPMGWCYSPHGPPYWVSIRRNPACWYLSIGGCSTCLRLAIGSRSRGACHPRHPSRKKGCRQQRRGSCRSVPFPPGCCRCRSRKRGSPGYWCCSKPRHLLPPRRTGIWRCWN